MFYCHEGAKAQRSKKLKLQIAGFFVKLCVLVPLWQKRKNIIFFFNPIAKITNNKRSYCIVNIRNLTIEKVCILDFLKIAL